MTPHQPSASHRETLTRRQALRFGGVGVASFAGMYFLSACGSDSNPGTASGTASGAGGNSGQSTDLTLNLMIPSSAEGKALADTAGDAYQQKYDATVQINQPPATTGRVPKIVAAGDKQWADVLPLVGSDVTQLTTAGLLEKLDATKIPNAQHVKEKFRSYYDGHGIGLYTPTNGIIYNKRKLDSPPDTWEALWDDKNGGLLLPQPNYPQAMYLVIVSGMLEGVDSFDKPDVAFKRLERLKPRVKTLNAQQLELSEMMRTGEVGIGVSAFGVLSPSIEVEENQIGIAVGTLKEGWPVDIGVLVSPKGHPHSIENVYKFIDLALTPETAARLQKDAHFVPMIDNYETPQEMIDQGWPTPNDLDKGFPVDVARLADVRKDWMERYQAIFA